MPKDPDLVEITTATTPAIAELIAGILKGEGIPAYVEGVLLQDQFAISQKLMGASMVGVEVPKELAAAARRVLEEARRAGKLLEGEDLDEKKHASGSQESGAE